ncbi:MAG: type VI secretion system ATPase TssH [Desulfobacterales bacterium]|nr:type VI secretion system ATPase TssH [Desulfobacterales bacterium]
MSLDLQSLIKKLDPACRKGLEAAAELCVSQTNYNVEIEHLLLKLLEAADSEIHQILNYYDIAIADIQKELTRAIDRFKRGNSRTPTLSPYILTLCEQAWLVASLQLGVDTIRTGAVFKAILDDENLRGVILESVPSLKRISRDAVKKEFDEIIRAFNKTADEQEPEAGSKPEEPARRSGQPSQTPALDQYTLDLTARARQGKIDPIYGRDPEIRQLIDILTRRRQNNPILTGDAGVGKTAVVEGFAIRIARGNVPPALKNVSLRLLDLALLQAGAGIKGEFEKRLKAVIEEVKKAFRPTILFIDEAHTMIGAGGPAGQGDAANLLKPALARGELRTIAATTWSEYKKYFEKDPALVRRFQVVKVEEPEEEAAVEMLRGVVANLEQHHQVTVLDEAVWDAVRLSHRYITGRQLPDKAISVLDTACARVAIGQTGKPPEIEDVANQAEQLELELAILNRENTSGLDHSERIAELTHELEEVGKAGKLLETRWQAELAVVKNALELQGRLHQGAGADEPAGNEALSALRGELLQAKRQLEELQGQTPMVPLCVDSGVIARVISNWTGIPVGKMMTNEIDTVLRLKEKMSRRIIGQAQALDAISRRIRTYRADLDDPGKPVGVFLLVGPSGIGKTETALTLAELLYGGERNMVTINMSEYQEAYTVSGLRGAPPGYVGHGKGGVLTEAVHHNPYTAVLLDEVEKAHPDVMELFYQVFDKGIMEDSEGLVVDFKNTVIMLTSNVGTEAIIKACGDSDEPPDTETLIELVRPELLKHFKPAFLGRLVIVPYYPLGDDVIRSIVRLKLERIQQRFTENHRVAFKYSDELVAAIAARCTEVDTGARNVDHLLTQTLLPEISAELLSRMAAGQICTGINADIDEAEGFVYSFEPPVEEKHAAVAEPRLSATLSRPIPGRVPAGFQPESIKDLLETKPDKPKLKKAMRVKKRPGNKSKKWRDLLKRL